MEPPSPALHHLLWPHSSLVVIMHALSSMPCNILGFVQLVVHTGLPLHPNVEFDIISNSVENFTVCLTWQRQDSDLYYLINTISGKKYNVTSTELCLRAEYNTPLHVTVVAVNCAGESEPGTTNITIGLAMLDSCIT